VNDAYQDVRYLSAGGKILEESRTPRNVAPANCGVGIFIDHSKNGKSVTIREIMPGSPAAASGVIQVHDHLLKIDGVSVKHSFGTLKDIVDAIRGIEGTKVRLQFRKCRGPEAKSVYEVILRRGPNATVQDPVVSQNGDILKTGESHSEDAANKLFLSHEEDLFLHNEQNEPIVGHSVNTQLLGAPSHNSSGTDHNREQVSSFVEIDSALPRRPSIFSDARKNSSGHLQPLSSVAVDCSSTNVFQRPTLQGFATNLGVILFPTHDHRYTVLSTIPNSRASKRNIMIGDLLLAIDCESVDLKSKEEVYDLLSHPSALLSWYPLIHVFFPMILRRF
jgi:hypothetical protein